MDNQQNIVYLVNDEDFHYFIYFKVIRPSKHFQYCKDIPAVNNNGSIFEFNDANATDSFNFKAKITGATDNNGRKYVEIMVPLKYLSNFWRTLEISLINCGIHLIILFCLHRCSKSK